MTRVRRSLVLLGLLSAVLAVAALWLALANPNIDGTSRGDDYPCAAPYDTALNDADDVPGGEPPADSADIAARCVSAGEVRFAQSVAAGAGAAILVAVAAGMAIRSRSRTPATNARTLGSSRTAA